jgi:excisionase family DNA binding protein
MRMVPNNAGELMAVDIPNRPMTMAGLAEWLDVSRRYLEGEVNSGRLRVRKLSPRLVRILPSDVAKWLAQAATTEG